MAAAGARTEEVAEGVYCVRTGRGLTEANVYLVRSGPSWVLIDAAWPHRGQLIKSAAESLFGAGARPAAILLTHIHPDHSGSALELARMWDLPVHVHPGELPLASGRYLPEYGNPLDRWLVAPLLRLMPRRRVEAMQSRGSLEGTVRAFDPDAGVPGLPDWQCVPTPGHTPGHIAFFRSSDRVLITGDAVLTMNLNSVRDLLTGKHGAAGPPYISTWNWPEAKESVAALASLNPQVLACGHGPPLAGPGTADHLRSFSERFSHPHAHKEGAISLTGQGMASITGEIIIGCPVEEVFDFVADERNEPKYNPRMVCSEKVTDGPVGDGTRFAASIQSMGRPLDMTTAVTSYERPTRFGIESWMSWAEFRGELTFEPDPAGTRMRWSWQVRPKGAFRLLTPVIAWIGKRQEQAIWTGLKRYLETRQPPAPVLAR